MGQLFQPSQASGLGKDGGTGWKKSPMLKEGFDLELEAGLAADGIVISLGGAFEEDAEFAGGLPDGFEFTQAQEAGQGEGIATIFFIGMGTDEAVVSGIADDQLLDVGAEELADPAGQIGFFEHEAFVGSGDGLDMFDQGLGLGAEAPPAAFGALVVEVSQETILRVGIQAQPCYRGGVNHMNLSRLMVNVLADGGRIRICSFSESLS